MTTKQVSELSAMCESLLLLPHVKPFNPKPPLEPETVTVYVREPRKCEGMISDGTDTHEYDKPCNSTNDVKFIGGDHQEYYCRECRRSYRVGEYA